MAEGEKLSWALQFDLTGQGLQEARAEMDKLQSSLKAGQKAMFEFEVAGKRVNFELTGQSEKVQKLATDWKALGGIALGAAAGIGAGFKALDAFTDKALTAFGERQGTLRAYTTLLGDATKAEENYLKAQGLALKTDLTAADTTKAQKKLMVAGFRDDDLDRALLGVADVAAMASPEERALTMERLGKAFADVRSKGKLQGEELKQLTEAGLGRGLIVDEVRKSLKLSDNAATEKLISKGGVTSDVGVVAIERAILRQFNTKKLGEYATGAGSTLSGMLSNRGEAMDLLLKSFDSEMLPAVQRYKEALSASVDVLSQNSKTGQNLSIVLQDLSSKGLEVKTAWTELETGFLETFSKGYVKQLKEMGLSDGNQEIDREARKTGKSIGEVGGVFAALLHPADALANDFPKLSQGMNEFYFWLKGYERMTAEDEAAGRNAREAEELKARGWRLAADVYGPEQGAGKGGGAVAAAGDNPYLKSFNISKRAPEKYSNVIGGAGKGGGGLGSIGGDFVPDYRDVLGGMSLPGVTVPGVAPSMSFASVPYVVEQQRQLMAGAAARGEAPINIELTVNIDGSGLSAEDLTENVAKQLPGALRMVMGRMARTPRPAAL